MNSLRIGVWAALLVTAAAACAAPRRPSARAVSDTVALAPPADSAIPAGPLGLSIRRGRALLAHTTDSLPRFALSALQCVSCHPDDGRRAGAMPWVGVYSRFPQYRTRSASVSLLEDRINDCFERSLNGIALPAGGPDMRDIVAYMAFLSRGVPVGSVVRGQGLATLTVTAGNAAAGESSFGENCARCHGQGGEGTAVAPPLWGPRSFNMGAGMARVRTTAAFIRHNMPLDRPGSLTEQQAFDLAVFIKSRPRPDFPGKERDWPLGGAPADVSYPTLYQTRHPTSPAR